MVKTDPLEPWTRKLRELTLERGVKEKPSNELGQWGGKATDKEYVTTKIKRPQDSHCSSEQPRFCHLRVTCTDSPHSPPA